MIANDSGLPVTVINQGGNPETRGSRYGDAYNVNAYSPDALAEDGELFLMTNATVGTGIAQTANTTADTTKPFIFMSNPVTSKKFMRIHRLRLKPTAVSSGQTVQNISVVSSVAGSHTSAGTDYNLIGSGIAAPGYRNMRSGLNQSSVADGIWVGVPVTVLGTLPRLITNFQPRVATIPVANDIYEINFGGANWQGQGDHAIVASTTVDYFSTFAPPCIIDPGTCLMIIPWAGSIGGAMSWELELLWSER